MKMNLVDATTAAASAAGSGNPTTTKTKAATAAAPGVVPLTVGNPAMAGALAIDQKHMEELVTNSSAQSSVVECRRPPKGMFFTVQPESGGEWKDRAFYYMLELPDRDPYIVAANVAKQKQEEEDTIRPILLVRYVTMTGDEGLWPVKLNPPDGKGNPWNTSALNILELAGSGKWVRIVSLKAHYRYQVSTKTFEECPPKFTNRPFRTLVDMAFKDHVITSLDHEIWDELKNGRDR
jgi:hypothetical protein